ncbi:hypothetical protein RSO01_13790 [Reyranella soli]|jgi:hypothetical protein|uniref:Uncharacterized protein n=1 Tax=Reyranella soli TaxID=1230389 RepID=A0A512N5L0_9HYPH|nr:hypothetical protein RSO01_13790 [Reyranella soli]
MQALCSIAVTILALAGSGECKTRVEGMTSETRATNVQYAGNGLPRLPSVPRLPSLPRLPRVPKPKWP